MSTVKVGDSGPEFVVGPLTRTDIVRYAGASGDYNPIHHDEEFAKSAGLPSVMAHGMLSAGLLASFVTRWFGAGSVRRFKVRFREQVWPGDVLRAEGRVTAISDAPDGGRAQLELSLNRADGRPVITGSADVLLGQE
jgi:acyl dehydratase